MVTFPEGFVSTKYPGYFWHLKEKRVYSVKVSGILTPLPFAKPNRFNHLLELSVRVSVNGRRRYLTQTYLMSLSESDSVMPVKAQ